MALVENRRSCAYHISNRSSDSNTRGHLVRSSARFATLYLQMMQITISIKNINAALRALCRPSCSKRHTRIPELVGFYISRRRPSDSYISSSIRNEMTHIVLHRRLFCRECIPRTLVRRTSRHMYAIRNRFKSNALSIQVILNSWFSPRYSAIKGVIDGILDHIKSQNNRIIDRLSFALCTSCLLMSVRIR